MGTQRLIASYLYFRSLTRKAKFAISLLPVTLVLATVLVAMGLLTSGKVAQGIGLDFTGGMQTLTATDQPGTQDGNPQPC